MKQADIEKLEELCRTYGAYEITKALTEYSRKTCKEFLEVGNKEAIIHKDYVTLVNAIAVMKGSHPLRKLVG